mgnify:CR=1 FL=1
MATEEPPFTLVLQDGAFEVRAYPALLAAETTVAGDRGRAANAGFRPLANFIFGAIVSREDIAMTAPVIQTPAAGGRTGESIAMTAPVTQTPVADAWVVRFIMPEGYTEQTLPRPTDPAVRIVTLPAMRMAVIRFSGLATPGALADQEAGLREAMARHGLSAAAGEQPTFAFYDPPWTPFFMRRNEIMIPLAET